MAAGNEPTAVVDSELPGPEAPAAEEAGTALADATDDCAEASLFRMSSDGDTGAGVRAATRGSGVAVTPPCGALAAAGDLSGKLAFADSAFAARRATTLSATR